MSRIEPRSLAVVLVAANLVTTGCPEEGTSSPATDAGADASALFVCTPLASSYTEQNDATNDVSAGGTAEATALVAGPAASVTIGGCIDSRRATSTAADADVYSLRIEGSAQWLVSRFSRELGAVAGGNFSVQITGTSGTVTLGGIFGTSATSAAVQLPPGDYTVSAIGLPGPGNGAYPYQLELWTTVCDDTIITTTYAETEDGPSSRGNDVLAVDLGSGSDPFVETSAFDAAEPIPGVPIAFGQTIQITGTSADVASTGDAYLDRDSFNVLPSSGTGQLLATVTWATGDDLDALFMDANQTPLSMNFEPTSATTSLAVPATAGEVRTLWIGSAIGSSTTEYTVTICAIDDSPP